MILLKHISEIRVSNVDKKTYDGEHRVRLCNYTDVYYGDSLKASKGNFMVATASLEQFRSFRLRVGDTVLTKDSESAEDIGVSAFIVESAPDFVCGYHLAVVRPNPSLADPKFISWALRSRGMREQMTVAATGVTRYGLRTEALANLLLDLPPLAVQRRVADFLDDQIALLDRAMHLRQGQVRLSMERAANSVRDQLTGADMIRVKTGNRWFPMLPPTWSACSLKQRWSVVDCKHRTPEYTEAGFPVVSTGDVRPGRLDLTGVTRFVDEADFADLADAMRRPRRRDIVYSRNASLGTACYVDTDEPFSMGQDVCRITSSGEDQLHLTHVLNYLVGPQIDFEKVGSTFSRINVSKILNLVIPMPGDRVEARRLGLAVDALLGDSLASQELLRRSSALLNERKQALITAAVTGEFDVKSASARSVA